MGERIEQTLAVLNGLIGDYLSRTGNGLATDMAFYRDGAPVPLEGAAFARAYPSPRARVVVLVHGLMCTESVWRMSDGSDYGSRLERDAAFSALYVRYNSGLPIADNGVRLAQLLQSLVERYPSPMEELVLIGFSMGGLVIRSACHVASEREAAWLSRVRRIVYVGTPHLGAPAERVGKVVAGILQAIGDPYTQLIADIGNLRSAGMQDLGHADLRHEDRVRLRDARLLRDARHPLPLLPGIAHHLIAGSMFEDPRLAFLFGDSLVPIASATFGEHAAEALLPKECVTILPGLNHLMLAHHADVYAVLRGLIEERS